MSKYFFYLLFVSIVISMFYGVRCKQNNIIIAENNGIEIWQNSNLDSIVLKQAIKGFNHFGFKKDKLVIIDFNKPSTKKRLFVIDLKSSKIIYKTYVAHGKNTGVNYAKKFSDEEGSHQSSLGFYKTAETYQGKHGYSLRLDGLEKGINSNAIKRAIVIHGADYVSQKFINKHGRLGRSYGCPALPNDISKEVIDLIKNGVCLFIYKKDNDYSNNSIVFK